MAAAEPHMKRFKSNIGQHLPVKGIIDECAAMACDGVSFVNKNACLTYRFRPEDLLRVTSLHQLPERFHTLGKHAFTGEEGLLLLLRRFGTTSTLASLEYDTGRSASP